MRANDLRQNSVEELYTQLEELLKEQFNLRMHKGYGQLARPSQLRAVRRDIARVKTILGEKRTKSQS